MEVGNKIIQISAQYLQNIPARPKKKTWDVVLSIIRFLIKPKQFVPVASLI